MVILVKQQESPLRHPVGCIVAEVVFRPLQPPPRLPLEMHFLFEACKYKPLAHETTTLLFLV